MEVNPSGEGTSRPASKEFRNILCNPKVRYGVHSGSPLVPILSQVNSVHITSFYFFTIHPSTILLPRVAVPIGVVPSGLPTQILHVFFSPSVLLSTSSSLTR